MPYGTLEVLLVSAKGLENTELFGDMDPYVVLTCRTQEKKSSIAKGQGSHPEWNESFLFTVTDDALEVRLKIMDKDTFTQDDFVGEATIQLEPLFLQGSVPETAYNVVKGEEFKGEIRVALTFTPDPSQIRSRGFSGQEEESYGGWKQSEY